MSLHHRLERRHYLMDWTNGLCTFNGESKKRKGHPAPFPVELPRRCILLFSVKDDTVLDPLLGSGTTLLAAAECDRRGGGIEIDEITAVWHGTGLPPSLKKTRFPVTMGLVKIRIIITGGTFDKAYDEIHGNLMFKDTHLPEILKFVRCMVPIELELNQLIDSLDMQTANRLSILESCRKAPEERIVITHGTDTMTQTAEVLGKVGLKKTIAITGAMVPYMVNSSDAVFNLGCALMAVQLAPMGVYIVMNGRLFSWDDVRKNKERGVFEEKKV